MKVVLPDGSGHVGAILARHSSARGDEVVINLAGRSVNCRDTPENRDAIMPSRVRSTQALGTAIAASAHPPRGWLQSSTATIHSHRYDAPNDEATGTIGGNEPHAPDTWRFSIDVAQSWEQAADAFTLPATRSVKLRSAMVMSPDRDGVFDTLLGFVRWGLGGPSGNGKQFMSWIHDTDFVNAIDWIVDREHLHGAINVSAPQPLPNADFLRAIRRAWGMPIGLPAMEWMLEVGAVFLQSGTELILKRRRVIPGTLLHDGFAFRHPTWPEASLDRCRRWREERASR